jgi:hypothetical protein
VTGSSTASRAAPRDADLIRGYASNNVGQRKRQVSRARNREPHRRLKLLGELYRRTRLLGLLATVMTTAKRLPPSGHAAAGLTMIISMNATVCGDMNHGEKRQFKIAGQRLGEEGAARRQKEQ